MGKTLTELRAMTAAQIRAAMAAFFAPLSKKELIERELDATEFADKPQVTPGEHGILTREQTVRDGVDDVMRIEKMEYDYYDTGEVHNLVQTTRNAKGRKIKQVRLEHFRDGRQPVLTVERIEEPTS